MYFVYALSLLNSIISFQKKGVLTTGRMFFHSLLPGDILFYDYMIYDNTVCTYEAQRCHKYV